LYEEIVRDSMTGLSEAMVKYQGQQMFKVTKQNLFKMSD